MLWFAAAIAASALMGIVNIIDSHLVSRRISYYPAYLFPVAVMQTIYPVIMLFLHPIPSLSSPLPVAVGIVSGVTRTASVIIMLNCMRREEVSRVIPIVNSSPMFVAILAVFFLGEQISWIDWLAILITIIGVILISADRSKSSKFRLQGSFLLLIVSSFLLAISQLTAKYAMENITSWNMYSLNSLCLAVVFYIIALRPATFREIIKMPRRNSTMVMIACNETFSFGGLLLSFVAIGVGKVALATTVLNIRPVFIFIFALLLSRFLPGFLIEKPDTKTFILKALAIALIIGGVAVLTLQG